MINQCCLADSDSGCNPQTCRSRCNCVTGVPHVWSCQMLVIMLHLDAHQNTVTACQHASMHVHMVCCEKYSSEHLTHQAAMQDELCNTWEG